MTCKLSGFSIQWQLVPSDRVVRIQTRGKVFNVRNIKEVLKNGRIALGQEYIVASLKLLKFYITSSREDFFEMSVFLFWYPKT